MNCFYFAESNNFVFKCKTKNKLVIDDCSNFEISLKTKLFFNLCYLYIFKLIYKMEASESK